MRVVENFSVQGEEGMRALGTAIGKCMRPGDALLLIGEMGMGKSVLARAVARVFGVQGAMPSPSFTILQSYEADVPVKHFDLYRLEDPAEFYEAGLDEEMDRRSVCLVEWPEMSDFRPSPRLEARIVRGESDESRFVSIDAIGMDENRVNELKNALTRAN